jgi:uncharacterized membrane protein
MLIHAITQKMQQEKIIKKTRTFDEMEDTLSKIINKVNILAINSPRRTAPSQKHNYMMAKRRRVTNVANAPPIAARTLVFD